MALRLALAALALLVLAPMASGPTYLSKPGIADGYTHARAAPGTLWLLLLVAQPLLLRASRREGHRRLGHIGVIVGAAFFVFALGQVAAVVVARLLAQRANPPVQGDDRS